MKTKTKYDIKKAISNTFGIFGYLSCFFLWVWVFILYFSEYKDSISSFLTSSKSESNYIPEFTFTLPHNLIIVISVVTVIFVLIVTVYALMRIPSSAAKAGKKIVHDTAEAIAPIAMKTMHKKPSKKMRMKITSEIVAFIKIFLIIIPTILVLVFQYTDSKLIDYKIVEIVGYWLCGFSAVSFSVQYLISRALSIQKNDIW